MTAATFFAALGAAYLCMAWLPPVSQWRQPPAGPRPSLPDPDEHLDDPAEPGRPGGGRRG